MAAAPAARDTPAAMNTRRCLRIAERMHVLLLDAVGHGIDARRMVDDSLYARDVVLVCDAMPGTELASLALHYRTALAEAPDTAPRSHPVSFDSIEPDDPAHPPPRRGWFRPARWFGR